MVDDPPAPPSTESLVVVDHVVLKGDTIWDLVHAGIHEHRGPGSRVSNAEIAEGLRRTAELNSLENPNLIHPGQVINVVVSW